MESSDQSSHRTQLISETTRRINKNQFISTVTKRSLFSLSARKGGLRIPNPVLKKQVGTLIFPRTHLSWLDAHKPHFGSSKETFQLEKESQQSNTHKGTLEQACTAETKILERIFKTGNSFWLTGKLSERERERFLPKNDFDDSLAIRYDSPLAKFPVKCGGCGKNLHVNHARVCKKWGLTTQRRHEIRAFIGRLIVPCMNLHSK